MPRPKQGSADLEDGPLIATPTDPDANTGLTRRRLVLVIVGIVLLALAAGAATLLALIQAAAVPTATLTPPASEPSASPSPTATASAVADPRSQTTELDGQTVWLALPEGEPIGIAVFFPGATDDPVSLLEAPAAQDLLTAGWAVSTGEFHGASWGAPASSADVSALRGWLGEQVGALPVFYVASEMGGSTSLASMIRSPELPVACWYGAATVTDLATIATAVPAIGDQLVSAWGRVPAEEETIIAQVDDLATTLPYRVVIPGPGAEDLRVQDTETLIAALEGSGHEVSQTTSTGPLATASEIDAADVTAMAEGCLG